MEKTYPQTRDGCEFLKHCRKRFDSCHPLGKIKRKFFFKPQTGDTLNQDTKTHKRPHNFHFTLEPKILVWIFALFFFQKFWYFAIRYTQFLLPLRFSESDFTPRHNSSAQAKSNRTSERERGAGGVPAKTPKKPAALCVGMTGPDGEHTHTHRHTAVNLCVSVRVFQPLADGLYLAYPRCVSGRGRHRCPADGTGLPNIAGLFGKTVRLHSKLTRLHATASAKKREKSPGTKERSRKIAPLDFLSCRVKNQQLGRNTWNTIVRPPTRWPLRSQIIWHDKKKPKKRKQKTRKIFFRSYHHDGWLTDGTSTQATHIINK